MSTIQNAPTAAPSKVQSSPARWVLLAVAVTCLLFSVAFITVGILVLKRIETQLTEIQRMAVFFHIAIYTFFVFVCFLGIYACLAKQTTATSLFTSLVIGQLLFSLASGGMCLWFLYNNTPSQPWNAEKCLLVAYDQFTRNLCQKNSLLKGFAVAMFTLMWQIEIGSVFLGNMFLNQLREDTIQLELLEPKYGRDGRDC